MISANEARKQMNEINTAEENNQLLEIEEKIKKDIRLGYTYYHGKLRDMVFNYLIQLGYEVKYNCNQMDGETTTIKW